MEIRTIFIPLLICTGIFGFTDGKFYVSSGLETTVYTFIEAAGLPFEYAKATSDQYKNEIINQVRKTCKRSGEAGVLTMVTKIQNTKECILSLEKSIHVEYSRITKDREGTPEDLIDILCPHLSDLESCLNNFKKDNPCLGPAELEVFDAYRDIMMRIPKFNCKNDGENYKKETNMGYRTCSGERGTEYTECLEKNTKDAMKEHSSKVISPSKLQKLPWSFPDREECAGMEKALECNLNVVQQCTDPDYINAIKDEYNEYLVALHCRNSANSQSSPGSLIILLIVTAFTVLPS